MINTAKLPLRQIEMKQIPFLFMLLVWFYFLAGVAVGHPSPLPTTYTTLSNTDSLLSQMQQNTTLQNIAEYNRIMRKIDTVLLVSASADSLGTIQYSFRARAIFFDQPGSSYFFRIHCEKDLLHHHKCFLELNNEMQEDITVKIHYNFMERMDSVLIHRYSAGGDTMLLQKYNSAYRKTHEHTYIVKTVATDTVYSIDPTTLSETYRVLPRKQYLLLH